MKAHVVWLGAAALSLSACASGARPELMAVSVAPDGAFSADHQLRDAVGVDQVQGGSQTNPLWAANISNEEFRAGLELSLRNAGLLAANELSARYKITANLQGLQRPLAGFDFTVTMTVRYSVVSSATGELLFDEVVSASGVGRMSDSLIGVERLRYANEAAARENISEFLRRLRARVPAASVAPAA